MESSQRTIRSQGALEAVTGVQLMQGIGVRPAAGFWADAWQTVLGRKAAVFALIWVGIIGFFAVFAPVLASGYPIVMEVMEPSGQSQALRSFPLWDHLSSVDLVLLLWAVLAAPYVIVGGQKGRGRRFWTAIGALMLAVIVLAVSGILNARLSAIGQDQARRAASDAARGIVSSVEPVRSFVKQPGAGFIVGGSVATALLCLSCVLPISTLRRRIIVTLLAVVPASLAVGMRWDRPLENFNYVQREVTGEIMATYTLIPWSPLQRDSSLDRRPPLTEYGPASGLAPDAAPYHRRFLMGTDAFGEDVLSQILHACRLAISIGLVSTGVALLIGVTMGAVMGYFGGWVDLILYRVVEIFMAVPVLFLLIVAVAVLPEELRNTYVIMAIIGCFTWTGMARFTRAEFMKLRDQDFVQSARAAGLPLRSILFRHMLPNGVAPVLVDSSFAVAAAISIEVVLSYLGLGPVDSASWGRLLSSAISTEGEFKWWLAVFPGEVVFLTVLSYNIIGESLRDAIDPKLKKARV